MFPSLRAKRSNPPGYGVVACFALLIIFAAIMARAAPFDPQQLSHAADYTFGYYPDGWRRSEDDARIRFAVQTNRYAMLFDASRGRVVRMGPIAEPAVASEAVAQDNRLLSSLPSAELTFSIGWENRQFVVTRGAEAQDQLRLYHVGKYLQHFDVQSLQIGSAGTGPSLEGVHGWMEAWCWTDRLTLLLHAATYKTHTMPPHEIKDLAFAATLTPPADYDSAEALNDDNTWGAAPHGTRTARALVVQNQTGAGIAIVAVHGLNQSIRVGDKGEVILEMPAGPLAQESVTAFPCVVVPSLTVKADALRIIGEMEEARKGALTVQAEGIGPYTGPLPVDYDPAAGWHQVTLGENHDANVMERVKVKLANPTDSVRTLRLNFAKVGGGFPVTGMSPILRDTDGRPIGLPVQISKNWHCSPAWFNGLTMVDVPAGRTIEAEFDLAYARWGGVPAVAHAQLCLIGYGSYQLWDQMAIGSWGESICYDPDVNLGRSMVDDMRPLMVWGMGKKPHTQWSWTHNVGGCDFLTLFLKDKPKRQFLVRQKTLYSQYGPVLSDVTYAGETPGGAIQSRVRTQSWRSDDYVRALYTLRYDVQKPLAGIERLAFFQLGADNYNGLQFDTMARGNVDGLDESWQPPTGGMTYSRRGEPMQGTLPWVGVFGVRKEPAGAFGEDDQGALADKAMIVRAWKARLNGEDCPLPHYSVFGSANGIPSALLELSPPKDTQQLEPGDFVEAQVEVVILPQKADDYYGPNVALIDALKAKVEPWALALREARGSNVTVSVQKGKLENGWPIAIAAADGQEAEFTIARGVGFTPVTIEGLAANGPFVLQQVNNDGTTRAIDQSTETGNDWWQADYYPSKNEWKLTFTLPLDALGNDIKLHFSPKKLQ